MRSLVATSSQISMLKFYVAMLDLDKFNLSIQKTNTKELVMLLFSSFTLDTCHDVFNLFERAVGMMRVSHKGFQYFTLGNGSINK